MGSDAIGQWALRASARGLRPWPVVVLSAWAALILTLGFAAAHTARRLLDAARPRSRPLSWSRPRSTSRSGTAASGPSWSSSVKIAAAGTALVLLASTGSWLGSAGAAFTAAATNIGNVFEAGYWAAAATTGELVWWGSAGYAQNGVDSTANWTAAPESTGASNWSQVSAGNGHTCGVKTDGTLWCWGRNDHGQLGLGNTDAKKTPTQVGSATTWSYVSAGGQHTCAIQIVAATRPLYCWGFNQWGQVGNATTTDQTSPVQVDGGGNWLTVSAGTGHTCAAVYTGQPRGSANAGAPTRVANSATTPP